MACGWPSSLVPANCARCEFPIQRTRRFAICRAREDAVNARTQARDELKCFLLRHDVRYAGKTSWGKTYYRWLATSNFGLAGAQTAFTEYWQAVMAADERVVRLTAASANSKGGASSRWCVRCNRCAALIRSAPLAWWRKSATSDASRTRAS